MLYQLSYSRSLHKTPVTERIVNGGWRRIRTFVGVSQRVYSPPPLATRASIRMGAFLADQSAKASGFSRKPPRNGRKLISWSWRRDLNPQPPAYKAGALPIELRQQLHFTVAVST
jgi:hypothetical protein